ncbi:DUF4374 domain-containing protein [Arachidicoccus ginsenosidivorans]|uniref:DUF4374 domain-containing protein n=1 Tax=Arachidicoccus ginsenosidivorans TaxID=496057 RepID=UPI001CEF5BB3|nr:DUF4374 domain-containing protein [Arachidicoccus ginsenosidivorans]
MKRTKLLLGALVAMSIWTACSKSDSPAGDGDGNTNIEGKFVIAATPVATEGVADYLLTADDLDGGTISTKNNGVEQDGPGAIIRLPEIYFSVCCTDRVIRVLLRHTN